MELNNKIALVTGASAGIGKEVSLTLVGLGVTVVGCARGFDRLEELADDLSNKGPGTMLPIQCDLTKEDDILNMFSTIKEKYGALHIVLNNAGRVSNENLLSGTTEVWRSLLDTNVLAPAIVAREAFKLMQETKVTEGNVVFVNSNFGHKILQSFDTLDFYVMTKHAISAMVKLFRKEILAVAPHIRCTSLSPGSVDTEIMFEYIGKEGAEKVYENIHPMHPSDIAKAVVYILTAPAHLGINELELESTLCASIVK